MSHSDWPFKLENASANGGVVYPLRCNAGQCIRESRFSALQRPNDQNFTVPVAPSQQHSNGSATTRQEQNEHFGTGQ